MKSLYLIPARSGSKGLINKNKKILADKPLIFHSIDFALQNIKKDEMLCISSDDEEILKMASNKGIEIHFKRPKSLATDDTSMDEVLINALNYFEGQNIYFDKIILLQPTSPFRENSDLEEMIKLFNLDLDMVVSVNKSKQNPYFNLFEEDERGFLQKSKEPSFDRRQDCPEVFSYNGSIYIINTKSLQKFKINQFKKIKKYLMSNVKSTDIDDIADWKLAEYYMSINENS